VRKEEKQKQEVGLARTHGPNTLYGVGHGLVPNGDKQRCRIRGQKGGTEDNHRLMGPKGLG